MELGVGVDIKICKTQIRHVLQHGGYLFSTLVSLSARLLQWLLKRYYQLLQLVLLVVLVV